MMQTEEGIRSITRQIGHNITKNTKNGATSSFHPPPNNYVLNFLK